MRKPYQARSRGVSTVEVVLVLTLLVLSGVPAIRIFMARLQDKTCSIGYSVEKAGSTDYIETDINHDVMCCVYDSNYGAPPPRWECRKWGASSCPPANRVYCEGLSG